MRRRSIFAITCLLGLAHGVYGGDSSNAFPSNLCWRSLTPDTGNQDIGLAITELALASNGSGETWLSWQENAPRILRWLNGRWSTISTPVRQGAEEMRYPVLAMGPLGEVILAASANGQDGTTALHIARWSEDTWEWIGTPLISSLAAFTHAHEPSISFGNNGYPVVAWSEERHVKLAGLFVAQWDGSSWQYLGTLSPKGDRYYHAPTVTVSQDKRIWLGWKEGCGSLRIARWDGRAWHDIGLKSLQKLAAGSCSAAQLSLVVDSKGQVWALWIASKKSGESSLALARWNGSTWTPVSTPPTSVGKDATVWSAHMILQKDVPIVAWSQSDATDNHRLYVSEWMAGNQWKPLISGLHLAEGVSDVQSVRIGPGDGQSFFVSWDEIGKDKRRTRLVQAYVCTAGETPASPPKSVVERDTWPSSVDEAAKKIVGELDEDSKARVRLTKNDDLILYYQGWGTGIRNSLGLWRGNEKLLKSCGQGNVVHPDECSMIIIKAVWKQLQEQP